MMESKTISGWSQVKKNPTLAYENFFEAEINFLETNISKNSVILDVGCGDGKLIGLLANKAEEIIGIDNDENAIQKSKENTNNLDNVKIFFKDAEDMGFEDDSFDFVISMGTIFGNFSKTKIRVLREIKRVLKNNGILILSVYNENALEERERIYSKYWSGFTKDKEGTVLYNGVISEQFSKEKITHILEDSGFGLLEIKEGRIFYLIKAQKRECQF